VQTMEKVEPRLARSTWAGTGEPGSNQLGKVIS